MNSLDFFLQVLKNAILSFEVLFYIFMAVVGSMYYLYFIKKEDKELYELLKNDFIGNKLLPKNKGQFYGRLIIFSSIFVIIVFIMIPAGSKFFEYLIANGRMIIYIIFRLLAFLIVLGFILKIFDTKDL